MKRALPRVKPSRFQSLALLCAWALLVSQGVFGLADGCGPNAPADQAAMKAMAAMASASTDACPHCNPRGESCPGLHGCNSQSAIDVPSSSLPQFVGVRAERPMPALPQPTSLSFPPPLRPPTV
jgi:hypothetical protein